MRQLLTWVVVAATASSATAQLQWVVGAPAPVRGQTAFDRQRERLFTHNGTLAAEYGGNGWANVPLPSYHWSTWLAYDENRGRVVLVGGTASQTALDVAEWDGQNWHVTTHGPTAAAAGGAEFVTFHSGLGKLICCKRGSSGYDLYTWDGVTFQSLPEAVRPPVTATFPGNIYHYQSLTYDRVRDKLILFGRSEHSQVTWIRTDPSLWEWDPFNGWVDQGISGTALNRTYTWFDEQRGTVLRYDHTSSIVVAAYAMTSSLTWSPITIGGVPIPNSYGSYDPKSGRYYHMWNAGFHYLENVDPASYDLHAPGCTTPGGPELELTRPHTRSWLGRTMSVDFTGLPVGVGILAMGFNDQLHAGNPLPLSLQSYGMPGCSLNVAVDAAVFARPSGFLRGTVTIPIPFNPALLGLQFYHQGFAPAPGQNPLGMLATPSMVGRIGRF